LQFAILNFVRHSGDVHAARQVHHAECMDEQELLERTMRFALRVTRFCPSITDTFEGRWVRGQLFRAATSMGANYRSVCRGRSRPDFISKLGVVEEESDEALYCKLQITEAIP
jgi:four helix bundle protein